MSKIVSGEGSHEIGKYNLPIVNVDEQRRNFHNWDVSKPFDLNEILEGDTAGTTDTDSVSRVKESYNRGFAARDRATGYTRIYGG